MAEIAREMHVSGDFVVPRLGGAPFLEKPPLHYAAVAAAYRALGVTPFAARLPSALAGLLTLGLTYLLGRRLFDRRIGFYAALLLPTMFLFFHATHSCLIDATLVLFVTGAFLCADLARAPAASRWAVPALYAAAGLAFLTKGFVGPVLIALGLLANALRERSWPGGRRRDHLLGLAIVALCIGGWGAALYARGGPAAVREAFLANSVGRMFAIRSLHPAHDDVENHTLPIWALPFGLLGNVLPWAPLLLLALLPQRFRGTGAGWWAGFARGRAWIATIVVVDLGALSLAHQKRGMFVLPLYPLIALLLTLEVFRLRREREPASRTVRFLAELQVAACCFAAILAVAALVVVPAWAEGRPPSSGGAIALAALGAVLVAGAAWRAARFRAAGRPPALRLAWALVLVSYGAAAIVVPRRIDPRLSLASFFERARTLTEERGVTPVLGTGNEGYVGLADLSLEKPLPLAIRKPELVRAFESTPGDLYVITKELWLVDFGPSPPARCEILLSATSARRKVDHPETIYLVALHHASAPDDAAAGRCVDPANLAANQMPTTHP